MKTYRHGTVKTAARPPRHVFFRIFPAGRIPVAGTQATILPLHCTHPPPFRRPPLPVKKRPDEKYKIHTKNRCLQIYGRNGSEKFPDTKTSRGQDKEYREAKAAKQGNFQKSSI